MMGSKSFESQELREGRKEEGESRSFPILWMEKIEDAFMEDVFQMEGKECKG